MFRHIMVPYDISAKDKSAKAVKVAGELARNHGSRMTLISAGVGTNGISPHSADEQKRLLEAYAAEVMQAEGIEIDIDSRLYDAPDPGVDID